MSAPFALKTGQRWSTAGIRAGVDDRSVCYYVNFVIPLKPVLYREDYIMAMPYRPSPAVRRGLRKLGGDIREARLRRNLSMAVVAERAATSRATLSRVEKGDPAVSAGILAGVLQALGLLERLVDLADSAEDSQGLEISRQALRRRASSPRKRSNKDE